MKTKKKTQSKITPIDLRRAVLALVAAGIITQPGLGAAMEMANAGQLVLPYKSMGVIGEDPGFGYKPGQIYMANDARFTETYFSQPLTDYAVGWKDPNDIQATLDFIAPPVEVGRRFEWKKATNAEEFLSETDDVRAIGADFKVVDFTATDVNDKTLNKGLTFIVDLDNVSGTAAGWQQQKVAKLLRRLYRNELRRSVTAVSAAATNTAKIWDGTAGKDPDQDVLAELDAGATASGIKPNRILYGNTAWTKRSLSLRSQNLAGQANSASLTREELAAWFGVDAVAVSKERYQSSAAAKSEVVNNLVWMFYSLDNVDTEDATNTKRFYSTFDAEQGGGAVRVFIQQISSKLVAITVEHYSKVVVTSTLGIRQFTVS